MADTIEFNQGDDYTFRLNNFNPEHNYAVYIQMFDEDGNFVGNQQTYTTNYSDSVEIHLAAAYTDTLTVPAGEDYQLYYLGGKQAEIVPNTIYLYAFYDGSSDTVYTHSRTPKANDKTYNEDNEEQADDVTSYTPLYAWTYGSTTVYTRTQTPTTSSTVYTVYNATTASSITAVTTESGMITDITISGNAYSRNTENDTGVIVVDSTTYTRFESSDTSVTTGNSYLSEKTIISELANKRPVIVYKKRAEGPA